MNPEIEELTGMIYGLIKNKIKALYLVGGAVRDDLMGRSSKDIDISLDADFDKMPEIRKLLETRFSERNVQYVDQFHNV